MRPDVRVESIAFEAQLRALAAQIMTEEAQNARDRVWNEDTLFQAMATYAAIKSDVPGADLLPACERLGRLKARLIAERETTA